MGRLIVVAGGQFGSEGKGAATAFLARRAARDGPVAVVRVAGPNAGHTAYDDQGRRWALRQIPVAAVTVPDAPLYISAGSEVDPEVLSFEIESLEEAGISVRDRLIVDGSATLITAAHREAETQLIGKIGSTGKGIGAARSDRIMRSATLAADALDTLIPGGVWVADSTWLDFYENAANPDHTVLIEGTQGYGLGLHAGFYPKCTSSDCRAVDFCAMAGIDPNWYDRYEPWVVLRTYPIRVAGDSGPMLGETSWEDLGFEPEKTTVTQKVRRVGEWDAQLAARAVAANGGNSVAISLSMADYVVPKVTGLDDHTYSTATPGAIADLWVLIDRVERESGAKVRLVGTGPNTFLTVTDEIRAVAP